jgi:hypothetical protein
MSQNQREMWASHMRPHHIVSQQHHDALIEASPRKRTPNAERSDTSFQVGGPTARRQLLDALARNKHKAATADKLNVGSVVSIEATKLFLSHHFRASSLIRRI